MSEEILLVERAAGVSVLTLNRPRARNALDTALRRALLGALEAASRDRDVRVVVLGGAGGAFCAGADLKAAMTDHPPADGASGFGGIAPVLAEYHAIVRAIASAPKPVIAMVDGAAVGFGCDLALSCDLRVASSDAYFQEKFVKIGLMPDGGGTFWLPRLVGLARAMEIMLEGEPIGAQRALELGIVNRVTDAAGLRREAMELAARLAKGPPLAFAEMKRAVHASLGGTIDDALEAEKAGQLRCLASRDCVEGVSAWMQKREPVFVGE